jgi:hypothetical protein
MSYVRDKISSVGVFLVIAGVLSCVLQIVGYELRSLRALNEAPPLIAWGVRIALIIGGIVLFLLGPKEAEAQAPDAARY